MTIFTLCFPCGLWVRTAAAAAVLYADESCFGVLFCFVFFFCFFGKLHETTLQRPVLILSADFIYKEINAGWCVCEATLPSPHSKALFLHAPLCPVSLINGLWRRKNWRIIQRKKIAPFHEPFEKQAAHEWSSLEGRKCANPLQSLFNVMWQKTTISFWWLFKSNRLYEESFFIYLWVFFWQRR